MASSASTLDDWLGLAIQDSGLSLEDLVAIFDKVVPDPGQTSTVAGLCKYGPEYDERFDEAFKGRFEVGGNVELARHVMGVYTRHTRATAASRLWAEHDEIRRELTAARTALEDHETAKLRGDLGANDASAEALLRSRVDEQDERFRKIREALADAQRTLAAARASGQYRDWRLIEPPLPPKALVPSQPVTDPVPPVRSSPGQDSCTAMEKPPSARANNLVLPPVPEVLITSKKASRVTRRSSSIIDAEMVDAAVNQEDASVVDENEDELRSVSSAGGGSNANSNAQRRKPKSAGIVANGHALARRWTARPLPDGVSASDAYVGWTQFPKNIKFNQRENWEAAINHQQYRLPGEGLFLRWNDLRPCDRCVGGTRRSPCGFKKGSVVCIACQNGPKHTECTYGGDDGHIGYVTVDGSIPCGDAPEQPFVRFNGLGFSFRNQEMSLDLWEEVFSLVEQATHALRRGDWTIIDAVGLSKALNGYYPSGRHETAFPPDIEDELRERVGTERFNDLPRTIEARSTTASFPPLYVTSKSTRALHVAVNRGVKRKLTRERSPSIVILSDSDSDVVVRPRKKRRLRTYAHTEPDVNDVPLVSDITLTSSIPSLVVLEAERLYRLSQVRKIEAVMIDKYNVDFGRIAPPALHSCGWYGCTDRRQHRVVEGGGAVENGTVANGDGHEQ